MGRTMEYPKKKQNTVNRYSNRARYDLETIHTIINTTTVLHVAFNPSNPTENPFPAVIPMIGVMASYDYPSSSLGEPLDCYLHGYISARMMRMATSPSSPSSSSSPDSTIPQGLPVTISATQVLGVVLALTPNNHSMNYRSAVLQGFATPVTDPAEKLWAMEQVTNNVLANRWPNTRVPPDNVEMTSTQILRVRIESGSGKIREGMPHDDKKDEEREDVTGRVWTGVVPVYEMYGEPVPSTTNKVGEVPEHVIVWTRERNEENERLAREATVE